jgi:perosamine synthetase
MPSLSDRERSYLMDAFDSGWLSHGEYIAAAEKGIAKLVGVKHAILVSNGTVAIELALKALGIGPGDEVIVPSLTYFSTAAAVANVGAVPVFIDCDRFGCMSPVETGKAITPRTKAILPVHLYGHPAAMSALREIAVTFNLRTIEDCAEGHGAKYLDCPVGSLGDIGCFSYFGNKIITCGEGGAIVTDNHDIADYARLLMGQGMSPQVKYLHPVLGRNWRLTNIQSAILLAQLERFDSIFQQRLRVFEEYEEGLEGIPGISTQRVDTGMTRAPWLFSIFVSEYYGHPRDVLMAHLSEEGIDSRPYFLPLHTMPPFIRDCTSRRGYAADGMTEADWRRFNSTYYPRTMKFSMQGMNLPTYPDLESETIARICTVIREFAASPAQYDIDAIRERLRNDPITQLCRQ